MMTNQSWVTVRKSLPYNQAVEIQPETLPEDSRWIVADLEYGYYQVGNMFMGTLFLTPCGRKIEAHLIKRWFYFF
jgi:hypothetical protein